MIYGIGTDIIDINRIKSVLNNYGDKFKYKCFHQNEISWSNSKLKSAESFAKRYAAKEACAKALGTGLDRGVFCKNIEVINNKYEKPFIKLHNNALNFLNKKINKNAKIELSLSDEINFAIANVIIFR